jgi:hypothetical protein
MILRVLHYPHCHGTDMVCHGQTRQGKQRHRRVGCYERHVATEQHTVGKVYTQKIESKHINLRTRVKRLGRRTICFAKTEHMHDLVIGLCINRYEFGRLI